MSTRTYTQSARAEATAETRLAVIGAAQSLVLDDENFDPSLEQIAERAGVSTRTVLRHFGSKDGVIEAAIADAGARIADERAAVPGDVAEAIERIVAHYEGSGDHTMRMLAEAGRSDVIERITDSGMKFHRQWVEKTFAPWMDGLPRAARSDRVARIASLTDVYMWHLLRRRYGLSRKQTETAIRELVETQGEAR
jgi:AcrR family transcriptional regulator